MCGKVKLTNKWSGLKNLDLAEKVSTKKIISGQVSKLGRKIKDI